MSLKDNQNIPEHWELKKLGEVCTIYAGYGFPKLLQGKLNGTYPFYKVGDISKNVQIGNTYLDFCENYIDEEILKN